MRLEEAIRRKRARPDRRGRQTRRGDGGGSKAFRSSKLGSAFSELPGAVVDLRYGWELASTAGRQECWRTSHAERPVLVIGSPPESKAFSLDQRRKRSVPPGDQAPELLLRRLSMANRSWSTPSPRTSMGSKSLVRPGLHEGSERTATCGRGAMRSALVWPGGALAFEGRWQVGTSIGLVGYP